jgi:hypothetical protein
MYPSIKGVGAPVGTNAIFRNHRARVEQRRKTHRAVLAHAGVNQRFDQAHGPERRPAIFVERKIVVVVGHRVPPMPVGGSRSSAFRSMCGDERERFFLGREKHGARHVIALGNVVCQQHAPCAVACLEDFERVRLTVCWPGVVFVGLMAFRKKPVRWGARARLRIIPIFVAHGLGSSRVRLLIVGFYNHARTKVAAPQRVASDVAHGQQRMARTGRRPALT